MKRPLNFVVIATLSIFLILRIAELVVHGFKWIHVIWAHVYLAGLALALVWEFKARPGAPAADPDPTQSDDAAATAAINDPPLVSLVLLLARPEPIDEDDLRNRLAQTFGEDLNLFARADEMTLLLRVADQRFRVINSSSPYVKDRQSEAMGAATPQLADAIRAHESWRSVDLLEDDPAVDKAKAYAVIGRALAELIRGVHVLALFCPETGKMTAWRSGMAEQLRDVEQVETLRR